MTEISTRLPLIAAKKIAAVAVQQSKEVKEYVRSASLIREEAKELHSAAEEKYTDFLIELIATDRYYTPSKSGNRFCRIASVRGYLSDIRREYNIIDVKYGEICEIYARIRILIGNIIFFVGNTLYSPKEIALEIYDQAHKTRGLSSEAYFEYDRVRASLDAIKSQYSKLNEVKEEVIAKD